MFIPNAPKADYRFRAKLGDTFERTLTSFALTRNVATIVRTGSADPATMITITCHDFVDVGDANVDAENWYSITTPWGSYSTTPLSGWDSSMECRLEIDQAQVRTSDCVEFSFEFDEMRFYVQDPDTGEFDLVHTIAGNSITPASGFDRRYCTVAHSALVFMNPGFVVGSAAPSCDTSERDIRSISDSENPCVGGWQIKVDGNWTSRPVQTKHTHQAVPPPVEHEECEGIELNCETRVPLKGFVVDDEEQSWHIEYYPSTHLWLEYGTTYTVTCSCKRNGIPCGIPWIWDYRDREFWYYQYTSEIWSAPTNAGLFDHVFTTGSNRYCCGMSPPPEEVVDGPNDETFNITYAATFETLSGSWSDEVCYELVQLGACCPPANEGDVIDPPEYPCYQDGSCCVYEAFRQVEWETALCGEDSPELVNNYHQETYKAVVDSNGYIQVYRKIGSTTFWEGISQVTDHTNGINPVLFLTPQKHLGIMYGTGSGLVERYSYDRGVTWSDEEVAILNGAYPEVRVSGTGGILRMAYVGSDKTLRGTYQGPGDTAQSAVFNAQFHNGTSLEDLELADSAFGLDAAPSGLWLGAFIVFGETSTSDWFSADNGRTWTRI